MVILNELLSIEKNELSSNFKEGKYLYRTLVS